MKWNNWCTWPNWEDFSEKTGAPPIFLKQDRGETCRKKKQRRIYPSSISRVTAMAPNFWVPPRISYSTTFTLARWLSVFTGTLARQFRQVTICQRIPGSLGPGTTAGSTRCHRECFAETKGFLETKGQAWCIGFCRFFKLRFLVALIFSLGEIKIDRFFFGEVTI